MDATTARVAEELKITGEQTAAVLELFAQGCTVPFIARYRKEATGSLDETVITAIRDRSEKIQELEKRRAAILESLDGRGLLTPELKAAIGDAGSMTALEDAYMPYRPKRKTRASAAAEKGLTPLAEKIFAQEDGVVPEDEAAVFLSEEKGVASVDDALSGAMDILAERFSEDADARRETRKIFARKAVMSSSAAKNAAEKPEAANYRDYFEWSEQAAAMPSHRVLAVFRGERDGFLSVSAAPKEEECLAALKRMFVKGANAASRLVAGAVADSYKRLLRPSMENELRAALKKRADAEAIKIFAGNVREVLMSPPMGQKATLALDPGLRTGCKLVCLDAQGGLLHNDVIFPHTGEGKKAEAERKISELVKKYSIQAIAIGNGTAGRETEAFVRGIAGLPADIVIASVNESGASVYSASEAARREFPERDVTVRGAVSIGRRLMDPMAELVKIDPKSIGVGQYQHDVDQKELKRSLDDVVMSCVNSVGVDVNTASEEILSYVSGLNKQAAAQMIKYREANGPFRSREALKKVPRLGPKTFEQAAGFLRVRGENPLDASAVHPENYGTVERMAKESGCGVPELMGSSELREKLELSRFVSDKAGLPTLRDIVQELAKPGRDPRVAFEAFAFDPGVREPGDLKAGMALPGIVTNVTAFGAFVDIGVHQDGLVHVSRMSENFVENPQAFLKPGQRVKVAVLEVDEQRGRISLSMKKRDLGEPVQNAKAAKTAKKI